MRNISKYLIILWFSFFNIYQANAIELITADRGLTFGQIKIDENYHTLLITKASKTTISAINISEISNNYPTDSLVLVHQYGLKYLQNLFATQPSKQYKLSDLITSPSIGMSHVAAGTNYAKHGAEAGIDVAFLFPKFSHPSATRSNIPTSDKTLLDYEVELCARFSKAIKNMSDFKTALKGFFLCGDITDRAKLLRNIDVDDVASGRGFTDSKSGDDYFPVSKFLVVPIANWQSVVDEINLKLTVNGKVKQYSNASNMILKLNDIVQQSLARGDQLTWSYNQKPITLLQGQISTNQAILTGTPDGVIFNKISTFDKIWDGFFWAVTFSFLNQSATEYVIESYIKRAVESKTYLQAGDEITMSATYLDDINLSIIK